MTDGLKYSPEQLAALPLEEQAKLRDLLTPKWTKYIPHTPTPKQTAFLLLRCKEAFYGGQVGGGKSDSLLMAALQYVDQPGYSAIIFRKTYSDLAMPGAIMDRAKSWLIRPEFKDEVHWSETDKKFTFFKQHGRIREVISTLQFGYMDGPNDRLNYQGAEFHFIGFDEVTHIAKQNYTYMFSRLRRNVDSKTIPLRVRAASNPPDNDGGLWVKERFVSPDAREKGRIFIRAGLDDNPFVDKETYLKGLEELDPVTLARLRDGDWDIVAKGNMFKREWFKFVEPENIPEWGNKVRWWDMASTDEEKAMKKNKSADPDYTVGFKMSESEGNFYIEDIKRERKAPAETEQLQLSTALIDGHHVPIREEQEPGSSGVAVIDNKMRTLFQRFNYEGIRSTGDKATRAANASAAAAKGRIYISTECEHVEEFFAEIESFPGGVHDDMVDGLSGAFNYLAANIHLFDDQPLAVVKTNEEMQRSFLNSDGIMEMQIRRASSNDRGQESGIASFARYNNTGAYGAESTFEGWGANRQSHFRTDFRYLY